VSFNYAPILATATRLIGDFGQTAVLTRTTRDAVTSTQTGVGVQAVINEGDRARIGGAEIPVLKFILSGALIPKKGDRLVCGTNDVVIMQADQLAPGATTIIWTVLARAG
jgi:hypothetical protein